jgi:peptidoglycan lytic transglycosylase G
VSDTGGLETGPPQREPAAPDEAPPIYGRPDAPGVGEDVPSRGADRRARRRRWRTIALVAAVAIVAVLVGGFLWVQSEANPSGPAGAQVVVTVKPGSGADGVASQLAADNVIGSSFAYRIWSQFHSAPDVEPGQYAFNVNSSFGTVDRVLAAGPNVFPITVPPGFTVSELAQRVGQLPGHSAPAFEAVATSGTLHSPWQPAGSTNLDGLLGTGVYTVVPGETDRDLLAKMIDRFNTQADALGLAAGSARLGYTPYQVITIASIVEKEGVIQKNLGPVARVVLNRLAAGMPLQMDSTVLYSEGRDGGPVSAQDLQRNTPYNTYLHTGLTPTPVCFPSLAALQATLGPPSGSWRYFVVVQQDGTEAFADTFAQQQANEAVAKARGVA